MISLSSVTLLLSAASTMAIPGHQIRNVNHNVLAKKSLSKRFSADRVTWYPTNTGPDACTGKNHRDDDNIVALNMPQFGSNGNGHCGKKIRITAHGVTAIGVIQDACATCYNSGEIDLTKGLFQKFASLDKGVFTATWEFVDDDSNDDDDAPKTTKKTTASPPKTTAKATTKATTKTTEAAHTTQKATTSKEAAPTTHKATTTTKETEAPAPTSDGSEDDDTEDDDEEDCEEYEDDDDEEEEKPANLAPPPPPPAPKTTHTTHTTHKSSSTPAKAATVPHVTVDATPSSIPTVPTSSSTSVSTPAANLVPTDVIPTDAAANAGADPTPSQDASNVQQAGGIADDTFGNSAVSFSRNKVLSGILTIALIAIQVL